MRHNDAHEWGEGVINNDVLKFRKVIEYESSCIEICFPYICLMTDGNISLMKLIKN